MREGGWEMKERKGLRGEGRGEWMQGRKKAESEREGSGEEEKGR